MLNSGIEALDVYINQLRGELAALRLAVEPFVGVVRRIRHTDATRIVIEAQNKYGRIVFGDLLTLKACDALLAAVEPKEGCRRCGKPIPALVGAEFLDLDAEQYCSDVCYNAR
jgi:hypothetical protein